MIILSNFPPTHFAKLCNRLPSNANGQPADPVVLPSFESRFLIHDLSSAQFDVID